MLQSHRFWEKHKKLGSKKNCDIDSLSMDLIGS